MRERQNLWGRTIKKNKKKKNSEHESQIYDLNMVFLKKELQSCRDWENKPAVYQWAAAGERNKRDQHCH